MLTRQQNVPRIVFMQISAAIFFPPLHSANIADN